MLTMRRTIGAKAEAVYGTAEAIAASDLFFAYDIKFSPNVEEWVRNPHRPSLSPMAAVTGRSRASISFKVELMGSSAAGTAPFYAALLRACAMAETIVSSTSVTYKPATTSLIGCTIKVFLDGLIVQLKGCRGSVQCEHTGGQVPMLSFEFDGLWDYRTDVNAWQDGALVSGSAYPTFAPKPFVAALLTIDTYKSITERLSWNLNVTRQAVPDANTAGSYIRMDITGRNPSGEIDAEAVTIATKDFMDLLVKKTKFAVDSFTGSDDTGNGTGSLNAMTDTTKSWRTNQWGTGFKLRDSAGVVFTPTANTTTAITVSGTPASGNYVLYEAGRLIKINMPKCQLTGVTDDDKGGIYNFGLPFKSYQDLGDDEISIVLS